MLNLKRAIALRRKAKTPSIKSFVLGSKSNGKIERAIRSWQARLRIMLKEETAYASALMYWLIARVSDVISKYRALPNGRTSYDMYTHHPCKHTIVVKVPAADKGPISRDKSGEGSFIGTIHHRNISYLICPPPTESYCMLDDKMPTHDEAYSPACLKDVTKRLADSIHG